MIQRWSSWLSIQEHYFNSDLAEPTRVMDWQDMDDKRYLMAVLGSGILRDMVMAENRSIDAATGRAQTHALRLLTLKGYAQW